MLALGLFTRLAACPIVVFLIVSNYERWRVGGFFWNKMGLEFTLMWTVAALFPGARRRHQSTSALSFCWSDLIAGRNEKAHHILVVELKKFL